MLGSVIDQTCQTLIPIQTLSSFAHAICLKAVLSENHFMSAYSTGSYAKLDKLLSTNYRLIHHELLTIHTSAELYVYTPA